MNSSGNSTFTREGMPRERQLWTRWTPPASFGYPSRSASLAAPPCRSINSASVMPLLNTVLIHKSTRRVTTARLLGEQLAMHPSTKRLFDYAREATKGKARAVETFGDLSALMGVTSATMTNWKQRGVSKDGAIKAEAVFGCSTLCGDVKKKKTIARSVGAVRTSKRENGAHLRTNHKRTA